MTKPAIVFVTTIFEPVRNGPAIYVQYLYDHFADSPDFDFHVVTCGAVKARPNLHRVELGRNSLETYRRLQRSALDLAEKLGPGTIVHGNVAHTMWMFRKYSGPLVVQVNDYDNATALSRWFWHLRQRQLRRLLVMGWRKRNERRVLTAADAVIYNSKHTAREVMNRYGLKGDKHQVIYKAVDTSHFARPKDKKSPAYTSPRLVFVGSNWRIKGFDSLVRALAILKKTFPNVVLDAVGLEMIDLSDQLKQEIEEIGVSDNIQFSGVVEREQLPHHFWNADVSLLPSVSEALGVSVLESLAAGTPAVASRVGGIPEIIDGSGCGVLVEPNSPKALAEGISGVLNGDFRRVRHDGPNRAKVFSLDRMVSQVADVYSNLG